MTEPGKGVRGEHTDAVEVMLEATGLLRIPEEAPLVALVRSLAKAMDDGGGSRAFSAYLSALKDVRRVLDKAPGSAGVTSKPTPPPEPVEEKKPEPPVDQEVADFASFAASARGAPRRKGA